MMQNELMGVNNILNYKNIILIGASTGGVKAVETILTGIPKNKPPIVVVLHMSNVYFLNVSEKLQHQNLMHFE